MRISILTPLFLLHEPMEPQLAAEARSNCNVQSADHGLHGFSAAKRRGTATANCKGFWYGNSTTQENAIHRDLDPAGFLQSLSQLQLIRGRSTSVIIRGKAVAVSAVSCGSPAFARQTRGRERIDSLPLTRPNARPTSTTPRVDCRP